MWDMGRDSGDVTLSAVPRLGCGSLDYRQLAQQIELKTGGMSAAPHVLPDNSQLDTYEQVGPARQGRPAAGGWGPAPLRGFLWMAPHLRPSVFAAVGCAVFLVLPGPEPPGHDAPVG